MGETTDSNEPLTRKQAKKVSKRKKLEALLRITELNERDRQALRSNEDPSTNQNNQEPKRILEDECCSKSCDPRVDSVEACHIANDGPSPKRLKPDLSANEDEEMLLQNDVPLTALPPISNIGFWENQMQFPPPNQMLPPQLFQAPQSSNSTPVSSFPFCPKLFQQNVAVQVSKPQPIFSYFTNGLTPLQIVPALLVPELRNIPAILGNSFRDSSSPCSGSFNNPVITMMPTVCGYFGNPFLFPNPNVRIPVFPDRLFPVNENPPSSEKVDDIDEDLRNLRRSLKARSKEAKATPKFNLSAIGETASLTTPESDRIPIFVADLQRIILKASLRGNGKVDLRCGTFKNISKVSGIKLLLLEGLSLETVLCSSTLSAMLSEIFPVQMECVMPTAYEGALLEELAAVPLTPADRTSLIKRWGSLEAGLRNSNQIFRVLRAFFPIKDKVSSEKMSARPKGTGSKSNKKKPEDEENDLSLSMSFETDKFPRTQLLTSAWQMIEEGYPLPLKANIFKQFKDFRMTKAEYTEVTPSSPMYGLDCEMCLTTLRKNELTRVSIINENHELIYDTLVMPPNKIINYLTEFSGITKEMMKDVTTTLEDVQEKLREILEPDAILVGQSLNSDLIALQLMHPYVIDTSIVFNLTGDRSRKSKLKYLAKAFLRIDIQHDATAGHDPVEDAGTALKLVQLKLNKSLEFGDAVLSQLKNCPFSIPEKILQEIEAAKKKAADAKWKGQFPQRPIKNMGEKEKREEEKLVDDNICASAFRYINRETVNIIGHPDIVNEYHKYTYVIDHWDHLTSKKPKLHRPNVVRGQDERDIVDKAIQCIDQSFCVIAHVQLDEAVPELISMEEEETIERFKTMMSDFSRAAPENSVVLLVLGGNSDGANGAVYLNIRKRKMTQTCKLPTRPTTTT